VVMDCAAVHHADYATIQGMITKQPSQFLPGHTVLFWRPLNTFSEPDPALSWTEKRGNSLSQAGPEACCRASGSDAPVMLSDTVRCQPPQAGTRRANSCTPESQQAHQYLPLKATLQ
jgi:hypothetical protein